MATVAFYGPDDRRATKVAVGIINSGNKVTEMEIWSSETVDVRHDPKTGRQVVDFFDSRAVKTVAMTDRIIGCPHEEGIDYPEGGVCPHCPFWVGRDRWSGEKIH